ncbi:ABC transporter permease [Neobacillus sp. M.A.Huq-85]|nr:ABC transporter permease [Neobacillus cucumis]
MRTIRFSWLGVLTFIVLFFVISPFIVLIPSSLTAAQFLSFPPQGVSFQWYAKILDRPEFIDSFIFSVELAVVTAIVATIIGTLAGLSIAKYKFRGKKIVNTFLLSPLSVPSLIVGIAVLIYFTKIGIAGSFLGLLLAHLLITIPYVVRLVLTGMTSFDYSLEKAAAIVGAKPIRVFWDITLPLIRPAVFSGFIFSFLNSFDNVTLSLFLVSPQQMTLPLTIFSYIQENVDPLISAISTAVILLSLIPVILLEKVYGLQRLFGMETNSH